MRFVTLFLKTENVHLLKDVGMIPYYLYKEHDVESVIATYRNSSDYSYADKEVKGLELDFVNKTRFGRIIDGVLYLIRNAGKIDVLCIYHLNLSSYFYEIAYRVFNRHGRIYLKLDMNPPGFISCFKKDPVGMIKRATIRRADLASVETTVMLKKLRRFFGKKILFVPNGCYMPDSASLPSKEKIILTVGNLGTYEKATDVLLEAYASFVEQTGGRGWKLKLVGSIDETFRGYVDEFYKGHPMLKDRVIFTGPISDREKLAKEYKRASVFTLPSLSESFGIVLVEAASYGCCLITSDMVPAGYDITDGYKYGMSVPAGDPKALSEAFAKMCNEPSDLTEMAKKTADRVRTSYDWSAIVSGLFDALAGALPLRYGK